MSGTTTPSLPGDYGSKPPSPYSENIPSNLHRAHSRLEFPPVYVVVGIYRLVTDEKLFKPAWKKCEHGLVRGMTIGVVWVATTFKIQRFAVRTFMMHSSRVTGLSGEAVFGFHVPFDLPTYATVFFISTQLTVIISYFISHGLRVARERAYNQTIESRAKGSEFWQPYVEEWDEPPKVSKGVRWTHVLGSGFSRFAIRLLLFNVETVPLFGIMVSAWLRALGTARYLHKPYFQSKAMTSEQVSTFIEERKWDYRAFGFAAALLERIPIVGLVFSVSNRIGAAMWAVDLEKRQHYVAEVKAAKTGQVTSSL
ncbi:uncharacterized protein LAESUDRAFT_730582 [Laetiporus sulphureus 93-53]|uniref:Uncharacterized protein n=1 Tax=Laetiporus sulphureus 93-53 TaxID=1314785 RepID=A0A165C297_9APHY|nr:uncharacterized protein LAESUDRAFT_730582 [Laetiporus sulphureus 93-53]KZT02069.1 hypothetical protein LAESUDRAFT_730582 [Laetiporus sulphureus 93-53]